LAAKEKALNFDNPPNIALQVASKLMEFNTRLNSASSQLTKCTSQLDQLNARTLAMQTEMMQRFGGAAQFQKQQTVS
jgi:hypothetical protein